MIDSTTWGRGRKSEAQVEVGGAYIAPSTQGPRCSPTSTCCSLRCSPRPTISCLARTNARRSVTDAEVVTLAVAQAMMDIPSDREFLAVARARLRHLIPKLPKQPGYWKRRSRLARDDRVADPRCSPKTRRATSTTSCWSTPRRSSAGARSTPPGAPSWPPPARTITAAATRAGFGACGYTCSPPPTEPHARRSSPPPNKRNATSRCGCLRRPARRRTGRLRQGLRGRDFEAAAASSSARRSCAPPARRARPRAGTLPDPPADRVDLLDAQGPPRPGTPPRPHPARPTGAGRHQAARARRRRLAQPLPRPANPRLRRARHLTRAESII